MKKIFLSFFCVFFLLINKTYANPINSIEVPENEQWMLDAIKQNTSLSDDDIHRIEYSFGTYYGAVNEDGLPNGTGILGLLEGDQFQIGIRSEFKRGKLAKNDEMVTHASPSLISENENGQASIQAINWGLMQRHIEFKNQIFGGGFNATAELADMAKVHLMAVKNRAGELLNSGECQAACDELIRWIDERFDNSRNFRSVEEVYETLLSISYINNYHSSGLVRLFNRLNWARARIPPFLLLRDATRIINAQIIGYPPGFTLDIDTELDNEEIRELKREIVTVRGLYDSLFAPFVRTSRTNEINHASLLSFMSQQIVDQNEESPFEDFRVTNYFNLRDNIRENVVEAKMPNGRWYEVEMNSENFFFQFTEAAARNYKRDSAQGGSDNDGGSSGDSGGGW